MKDLKVLLTSAGSPAFSGAFRSLKMNGEREIEIIATDMDLDVYGKQLADKFCLIPPASSCDYTDEILEIVKKEKINVIFPLSTAENIRLAMDRKKVNIPIIASNFPQIKDVTDKAYLYTILKDAGFKTINFGQEILSAYPKKIICVKPIEGEGTRGFRILDPDADTNKQYFKEKEITRMTLAQFSSLYQGDYHKLLFMEYIDGKEYSIDLLLKNNKTIAGCVRLREKVIGGVSNIGSVVDRPDILKLASNIAEHFKLNYNIGIQIIEDKKGNLYPIEINPRLQGTTILCTAAGLNLPYLGLKIALNEEIEIPKVQFGTKMYRSWDELYEFPNQEQKKKQSIVIDFDGVISQYPEKYKNKIEFGKIIKGTKLHLKELSEHYNIIIYTSRKNLDEVKAYLKSNEIPFNHVINKPDAVAYIDDRAINFTDWADAEGKVIDLTEKHNNYFGVKK